LILTKYLFPLLIRPTSVNAFYYWISSSSSGHEVRPKNDLFYTLRFENAKVF
jgi:hypothetical protein